MVLSADKHKGKWGYMPAWVCVLLLITGSIYVFTCLKAWGGAFDVGSITHMWATTAMVANVFSLTGFAWNIGDKHRLLG